MALFGGISLPNRPDPANIQRLDVMCLPILGRMSRFGMRIDKDHFSELEIRMGRRMAELRKDIIREIPPDSLDRFLELSGGFGGDEEDDTGTADSFGETDRRSSGEDLAGTGFNVESPTQIAELLYDVLDLQHSGVEVKKTKSGGLSTGKKTLEQLKREHPVVPMILEYRENSKLRGTYALAMPRKARLHPKGPDCPLCRRHHYEPEWRVHTQNVTTRTATGRTASRNPNLANIPARSALGREIRAGFIPGVGCVFAQRDFSQIELRLLADQSGDPTMIDIYLRDGDIHVETAVGTFNLSGPDKVDKLLHRAPAKNVNFAIGYGISGQGLLDLMAVTFATAGVPMPDYMTVGWCDEFIESWLALYSGAKRYFDQQTESALRYGIAWTAAGRVRRIPEVRSCHEWRREAGVRQALNHGIQGYSADLMKLAMAELDEQLGVLQDEYLIPSWPAQTIYDELLIETEEDHGETIEALLGEVMDNVLVDRQTGVLQCRVPIVSDGHVLTRWTKD